MTTRAMRTTTNKGMEMLLDLPTLNIVVEAAASTAAYHLLRADKETLETEDGTIWKKVEKVVPGNVASGFFIVFADVS